MFLTTNVEDQKVVIILLVFRVSFIILFKVTISVVEYRLRNVTNLIIDESPATSSHPLLLNEEMARIFFNERLAVRLEIGVTRVDRAITSIRIFISSFSTVLRIREIGRIFCQVITTIIEFCFISMLLINFIYHKCVGHAPIFMRIENTKIVEDARDSSDIAAVSMIIEAITWII